MNSIIWRGVSSTLINGLIISELPPISKPEMKIKQTSIDGMDGSIIEELGYSSYTKTIAIGLHGKFDINQVIKYFTGEGDIVFSNEPDKVYKAKICGKIDYARLLRYRTASIPFIVQPYKYKYNEYLRETPTATASGTNLVINKNAEEKIKSFKIYGKSTQNGTPTLDAPVDIVSIGDDGNVMVSVNEQSIAVQTPNGLRGIPITDQSFATYTDASGQMWCADEIDLERGFYVQRIKLFIFTGNEDVANVEGDYSIPLTEYAYNSVQQKMCLCNYYPSKSRQEIYNMAKIPDYYGVSANTQYIRFVDNLNFPTTDINGFKNALVERYELGNPVVLYYILESPIETPLTEEEIATYKTLMSNISTATISNDENAYMLVEYFKPFEVFNEGLENSKPLMILKGSGTVEISVNGVGVFSYTFPDGENEVYIDSEIEDAYLGDVLKNRNMNGEFPVLLPKTNKIEWSGDVESISILPRSRWL